MSFPQGTRNVLQVTMTLLSHQQGQETLDSWHLLKFHRTRLTSDSTKCFRTAFVYPQNEPGGHHPIANRENVPASSRLVWEERNLQVEFPWHKSPLPLCSHSTGYQPRQEPISQLCKYSLARLLPPTSLGAPIGQKLHSMQPLTPGATKPIIRALQTVSKYLVKHHPTH